MILHKHGGHTKERYRELHPPVARKVRKAKRFTQRVFPIENLTKDTRLVSRFCKICKKQFAFRPAKHYEARHEYCSGECYDSQRELLRKYKEATPGERRDLWQVKNNLPRGGFYETRKDEYKDKIISYEQSPTGKAYIGINKTPFMPAADKGFGFQGVLMQDDNRDLVQCHACGKWMRKIANAHLQSCSGLTTRTYKVKYGLDVDKGLVSDETSLRLTKACLLNKQSIDEKAKNNPTFQKHIGKHGGRSRKHAMEFFNKYGTCPLQLQTRLYEFIRCNREIPGPGNRGRSIYKALSKRYISFNDALRAHGLPTRERRGTNMKYIFPDHTIYKYNMNVLYDREELYQLLLKKCPALSAPVEYPASVS